MSNTDILVVLSIFINVAFFMWTMKTKNKYAMLIYITTGYFSLFNMMIHFIMSNTH